MAPQPLLSTSINININICPNILRTFRWTLQWSFGSEALCEQLDEHTVKLTTTGLMLVLIEMTIQYSFNHFNTASHTYIPEPFSIISMLSIFTNISILISVNVCRTRPSFYPFQVVGRLQLSITKEHLLRNSCWGTF